VKMSRIKSSLDENEFYIMMKKAWRLHSQILPYKRYMEFGEFDIYSFVVFAKSIGGDHRSFIEYGSRYNLEQISKINEQKKDTIDYKQRLGIFIADVSGHDFEDLLLVHNLHSSLYTAIPYELEKNGYVSSHLFDNLNTRMFNSTPLGKYISAIYAEIRKDRFARFMIAGHPLPLIYDIAKKDFIDIDYRVSVPLGIFPTTGYIDQTPGALVPDHRASFEMSEFYLPEKSITVLYTDGVVEIEDKDENEFGLERLKEVIVKESDKESKEIFRQVLLATNKHRGVSRNHDDRTMVVIKKS